MNKILETENNPPNPSKTINSFRDIGYEYHNAVADIIDNSIEANATKIIVEVDMTFNDEIEIFITDNGDGMNKETLRNAMRYGSETDNSTQKLGKYGLGLKTASTSCCRKLVVTSRSSDLVSNQAAWDLDHIAKTNEWEMLWEEVDNQALGKLDRLAPKTSGTVISWKKIDELSPKSTIKDKSINVKKHLNNIQGKMIQHLSWVFQRFLDHDDQRAKNISIMIDGIKGNTPIVPYDPFCTKEEKTEKVTEDKIEIIANSKSKSFQIKSFVLPLKEEFSSEENRKKAQVNTTNQGIYLYRENRLIVAGGWLGMFENEMHHNLSRIDISFDRDLDRAFNVDVKKMDYDLDDEVKKYLKQWISPARNIADNKYRRGRKKKNFKNAKEAHTASNRFIDVNSPRVGTHPNIINLDRKNNEATYQNQFGEMTEKMTFIPPGTSDPMMIVPTESLDDGVLWEPAINEENKWCVRINISHPYYEKVFKSNYNTQQLNLTGMDTFIWSLGLAEKRAMNQEAKRNLKEYRFEVSRILRELAEELPSPRSSEDVT